MSGAEEQLSAPTDALVHFGCSLWIGKLIASLQYKYFPKVNYSTQSSTVLSIAALHKKESYFFNKHKA